MLVTSVPSLGKAVSPSSPRYSTGPCAPGKSALFLSRTLLCGVQPLFKLSRSVSALALPGFGTERRHPVSVVNDRRGLLAWGWEGGLIVQRRFGGKSSQHGACLTYLECLGLFCTKEAGTS